MIECSTVDELAGAYALGSVEPDEDRLIGEHLTTCGQPHAELRELVGVAGAMAVAEPVEPSPALRDRLMATIAATPQEHRPLAPARPRREEAESSDVRPWWRLNLLPAGLAAVALAAAVGLGAWGVSLNERLTAREAALAAVANADAAFSVSGTAGSGWLIETDGHAHFVADGLPTLSDDELYELWLIDEAGVPTATGTFATGDELVVVPLEHDLGTAVTFAVTVEPHRVEAPTGEPVLVAALGG
jgi:anti-sigma-K factor RskA